MLVDSLLTQTFAGYLRKLGFDAEEYIDESSNVPYVRIDGVNIPNREIPNTIYKYHHKAYLGRLN